MTDAIGEGSESKTAHKPLRLKTFLMILVMIVTGPLGNVLLGKGMKHVGFVASWPPSALLHTAFKVFASTSIWLGISSLVLFFVSYMLVLSWADYSFVQPASSLAYGVVALLGYLVLGETISPLRWAGIAVMSCNNFGKRERPSYLFKRLHRGSDDDPESERESCSDADQNEDRPGAKSPVRVPSRAA